MDRCIGTRIFLKEGRVNAGHEFVWLFGLIGVLVLLLACKLKFYQQEVKDAKW